MKKQVLVVMADGTEEMEAVIVIDILRRAGLDVVVAGLNNEVTCSRGVKIIADTELNKISKNATYDLIFIPGGLKGVENLIKSSELSEICMSNSKGYIAAICAAPLLLHHFGLISTDMQITSHPSVKDNLAAYNYSDNSIVQSSNIITSRGAGTALDFGLYLVELLLSKSVADQIANDIVYIRA